MSEEVIKTALAQIVRRITVDDGDILVVRTVDDNVLTELGQAILEMTGKHVILVEESQLDLLREVDEKTMREYGWQRIK